MIEHVFSPEMMHSREEQLINALLDCASVCYDINFTQDRIMGTPIQIVDGVELDILAQIGKPKNCTYTEIIDYWVEKMPAAEVESFAAFSEIQNIRTRYAAGERLISHRFWTYDIMGNPMLAEQKIRLYEDITNGDLLGLVYVSNGRDYDAMRKKEAALTEQFKEASVRVEFLETLSAKLPGGYHRCGIGDGFPLEFVTDSFVEIVGWTRDELRTELDNRFINVVAPEDRAFFMGHEPALVRDGRVDVAYRICRKDGTRRWVQDATVHVEKDGLEYYQCCLMDITDFVNQQEELSRKNLELLERKTLLETMEDNMPSGYHRCKAEEGCPFLYIGRHFLEIVGFTREEIAQDFGNLFQNLIWPEDADVIATYDQMLQMRGTGNVYDTSVYRVKHKDGSYRWVTDSTMYVDLGEDSFFQGTIADITEYMDSLSEAKKRAEASSQAKSTFLFNASHDIRTPMNAIKGFAHIIEENAHDPQIVLDTVSKIQQASDTLMTLMNDVLELARIEQGKEELSIRTVDLYESGKNLYQMFASEMHEAGIRFFAEGNAIHDVVLCDDLKLTRIMMNMLSNAKKFTPAGGTVTFGANRLHCDEKTCTYRFFVRDTGIGMSAEFQKRAFDQFERERSSTDSGISGSGLGLAIIKRLAELMGGSVHIESQLHKGTAIYATLTFPLATEDDRQVCSAPQVMPDMTGKRVLLVEDNAFNREIARYILEGLNFTVEEAENGLVCVDIMQSVQPGYFDLILMDIQMPVMDGYTATAAIRSMADEKIAATPIVAMTANAFDEDKQHCLAAGMNGHIGKPIEIDILMDTICQVL